MSTEVVVLQALVVLLDNGCLCVGVSGYRVSDFPKLVFSVSEEAGVGLRAGALHHEVAAELSLELLGIELGASARSGASEISTCILVTSKATSRIVILVVVSLVVARISIGAL
jgi:hypothetical protein